MKDIIKIRILLQLNQKTNKEAMLNIEDLLTMKKRLKLRSRIK